MKTSLLASLVLPLLLTQCVDPSMPNPNGSDPYANPYRMDMRDQASQLNRQAYERGQQDGQMDAANRGPNNYRLRTSRYDYNTEAAYRDGYNAGYNNSTAAPAAGGGAVRDPAYNQGYDYGLRDRTGGRVADPAAQVGRYDPRYRASFERGYYDGYNSRSTQNAPANPGLSPPGSGGSLWFR